MSKDLDEPHDGLTCFCLGHCPDHVSNGTCKTEPGGYCFAAQEEVYDSATELLEIETTFGCFPGDERGFMQCKGHLVPHEVPKTIACCTSGDLCNIHLKLNLAPSNLKSSNDEQFLLTIVLLSLIILAFVLLLIILTLKIRKRRICLKSKQLLEDGSTTSYEDKKCHSKQTDITSYSQSGSGKTLLVPITIAKQTQLQKIVGKGKFGEVWKGVYHDEDVAVKIFLTLDEASWLREQEIYQTPLLNHPNILGFVAADMRIVDSCTQLLLVTEYHKNGSLYDYLQHQTFDESAMLHLMYSAVSGLCHLHMELIGKQIKPTIAHRDLKSKNILVKNGNVCVIGDFGLAVKYGSSSKTIDLPSNSRVGTIRYMPPELLDGSFIENQIESYKLVDIYSMSLVLWEISRKCLIDGKAEEYQLPYFDVAPNDPSFEDMKKIVCIDGRRPLFSSRYNQNNTFLTIIKMLNECWHGLPRARLSALRMKKNLAQLIDSSVANV